MRRLIVAITGATGAALGVAALRLAATLPDVETHAIITPTGLQTLREETGRTLPDIRPLAHNWHRVNDLASPLASGSFEVDAMIVAPCSVKTLSGIATSYDDSLVIRAADVTLKERRPLVLLFRETPLHLGHIRLMEQVTLAGGIIMPPLPAFYLRPASIAEMIDQTVARAFDLARLPLPGTARWTGQPS
jgi:4-hydroxy-3-polyprenylbenzoate decarboxylase